jgi:hypothetical protein
LCIFSSLAVYIAIFCREIDEHWDGSPAGDANFDVDLFEAQSGLSLTRKRKSRQMIRRLAT